ncbi:peptidase inhibitor family I36 protein [Kribbella sp. NPDC002412]
MHRRVLLGAASAVALTLGIPAAPASASALECEPGLACFFETVNFTGKVVRYDDVPDECTRLPFAPGALFNWSDEDVLLYRTADCSGTASLEPANNFHSYPSATFLSFRAG